MTEPSFWTRLDERFERWSEQLHPIAVKETRQALQSRAFPIAFLGILAVCEFTSVVLAATYGDHVEGYELGPEFLPCYLGALLTALCLVVPLGLFQSVTSEFDGQTFEVLVITQLSPQQIVLGKLKSAHLQMLAFYCAVAPFLSLTYLLEGVSLPGILLALAIAYFSGLCACLWAMFLGALAQQSFWQVLGLLLTVAFGVFTFAIGMGLGTLTAVEVGGLDSLVDVVGGFLCFAYFFAFFALLSLGISIARFTPTTRRPESSGPPRRRGRPSPPGGIPPPRPPAASRAVAPPLIPPPIAAADVPSQRGRPTGHVAREAPGASSAPGATEDHHAP